MIAGWSNWRFLLPSRRLLLGAGPKNHPGRNNSDNGNQKQRRDRASHGTPPFTQGMNGTTEGAARPRSRSASRRKPTGERYREVGDRGPRQRQRLDRSRGSCFIWRAGPPRSLSGGAVTSRWPQPLGSPGLGPSHGVGSPLARAFRCPRPWKPNARPRRAANKGGCPSSWPDGMARAFRYQAGPHLSSARRPTAEHMSCNSRL
jgi:hypothetical protein